MIGLSCWIEKENSVEDRIKGARNRNITDICWCYRELWIQFNCPIGCSQNVIFQCRSRRHSVNGCCQTNVIQSKSEIYQFTNASDSWSCCHSVSDCVALRRERRVVALAIGQRQSLCRAVNIWAAKLSARIWPYSHTLDRNWTESIQWGSDCERVGRNDCKWCVTIVICWYGCLRNILPDNKVVIDAWIFDRPSETIRVSSRLDTIEVSDNDVDSNRVISFRRSCESSRVIDENVEASGRLIISQVAIERAWNSDSHSRVAEVRI